MTVQSVLEFNACFDLGSTKSLSFCLGFGASINYGVNPCVSPIFIHNHQSSMLLGWMGLSVSGNKMGTLSASQLHQGKEHVIDWVFYQ